MSRAGAARTLNKFKKESEGRKMDYKAELGAGMAMAALGMSQVTTALGRSRMEPLDPERNAATRCHEILQVLTLTDVSKEMQTLSALLKQTPEEFEIMLAEENEDPDALLIMLRAKMHETVTEQIARGREAAK